MVRGGDFELADLRLLAAVNQMGSLGQVAAAYGVSQPAVSTRMRQLERRLGLDLLRRDPTGSRLTAVGEEILSASLPVLFAADRLAATAERLRASISGSLRIAASFTVAEHLAPGWIETVRRMSPDVSLVLEVLNSAHVITAVEEQRVDMGFVEGPWRDVPSLRSQVIGRDELVVVVSPDIARERGLRPLSGAELAGMELIVREQGSGTRETLNRALAPWGGLRSRLELGSSGAILAATRRGEGVAVVSRLVAEDDVADHRLVVISVRDVDLRRDIRAVWPTDVVLSPLARRLLAAARDRPFSMPSGGSQATEAP